MDENRYQYYMQLVQKVDESIHLISQLENHHLFDSSFIEFELIPALGLNNEALHEQPIELKGYFGTGLHLWQYPSQLSRYLVWLSYNATQVKRYMEIGCRWGGTFIVINEWLKRIGARLELSIAVDPIEPTPFIKYYQSKSSCPVVYIKDFSTSENFKQLLQTARPDMVFIDGDHSMSGVMNDHLLVRNNTSIIVHHDIHSQSCPDTVLFWQYIKKSETDYEAFEFIDQYPSVNGKYLGIGVLARRR